MWGKGKVLLAAAIVTALVSKAAAINPQQADKAPQGLVHTYSKCRDEAMKKFINSGLLQQELNKSADFTNAWTTSKGCSNMIPGRSKEHSTALDIFLKEPADFFSVFNEELGKLSKNVISYEDQFHFKSFYFLLMDSMTRVTSHMCRTAYVLAEDGYRVENGSSVRFGRFVKVDTDINKLQESDDNILLNITSCFFVGSNVCDHKDDLLILSPAEVFTVEDFKKINSEDITYNMIVLNHQSVDTSKDCSMLSRSPRDVSTQWLVLVLGTLLLLHINL